MKKLLVAFNGEMMCFVHVLLNAMDMNSKGYDVKVIIEGSATRAASQLGKGGEDFSSLYEEVLLAGLIEGACQACAYKMGVLNDLESQGLSMLADMKGHPSLAIFIDQGYDVITF